MRYIIMNKRIYWTTETFKNKVTELTKGEYELLGEYTKTHAKTTFKHLKCNQEFEMTPHNFLTGQRCPHCRYHSKKMGGRKSFEQFKKEVTDLTNGDYDVLPPYVNSKTKVEFIHKDCGNHFMMRPNSFLSGNRCPKCSAETGVEKRTMTNGEFKQRVKYYWGDSYTVLGNYVNSDTPVKVRHNKCGTVYMTRPADFLRGHGCQKCAYKVRSKKIGDAHRDSLAKVKESIKNILGDQYRVLTRDEDYQGNRQHILLKHLVCGHTYTARYSDIQHSHTGCPYCAFAGGPSSGELKIKHLLEKVFQMQEHINYEYGYVIPDLKDKNNLHFDFWLPQYNIAIEYDGRQHFNSINYFGGVEAFKTRYKHDLMKNKYCKDKNITLIRIPYTMSTNKEINAILSKYLCGPNQQ